MPTGRHIRVTLCVHAEERDTHLCGVVRAPGRVTAPLSEPPATTAAARSRVGPDPGLEAQARSALQREDAERTRLGAQRSRARSTCADATRNTGQLWSWEP